MPSTSCPVFRHQPRASGAARTSDQLATNLGVPTIPAGFNNLPEQLTETLKASLCLRLQLYSKGYKSGGPAKRRDVQGEEEFRAHSPGNQGASPAWLTSVFPTRKPPKLLSPEFHWGLVLSLVTGQLACPLPSWRSGVGLRCGLGLSGLAGPSPEAILAPTLSHLISINQAWPKGAPYEQQPTLLSGNSKGFRSSVPETGIQMRYSLYSTPLIDKHPTRGARRFSSSEREELRCCGPGETEAVEMKQSLWRSPQQDWLVDPTEGWQGDVWNQEEAWTSDPVLGKRWRRNRFGEPGRIQGFVWDVLSVRPCETSRVLRGVSKGTACRELRGWPGSQFIGDPAERPRLHRVSEKPAETTWETPPARPGRVGAAQGGHGRVRTVLRGLGLAAWRLWRPRPAQLP